MDARLKLLAHSGHIQGLQQRQLLPPVMVDVDPVDGVCNLDCEWCCQAASRASRPASFMPDATMQYLGKFCSDWGVKAWRVSGDSEPLLHKGINTLLESGLRNGIEIGVITNGVFLERIQPEILRRLTYLGVSLDATTAATWSRLKRSPVENYYKILDNVAMARSDAPELDISLKFIRWSPDENLHKQAFGDEALPVLDQRVIHDTSNHAEAATLAELAAHLRVRSIVKDAYPTDMASRYNFQRCNATPLGGVFDADHKFHLCCDARNRFILTQDYTAEDWSVLPRVWGSPYHWSLIESIVPAKCAGCAKAGMNEVLEQLVIRPAAALQVNFI